MAPKKLPYNKLRKSARNYRKNPLSRAKKIPLNESGTVSRSISFTEQLLTEPVGKQAHTEKEVKTSPTPKAEVL